jgi:uncharacterized protein DUF3455
MTSTLLFAVALTGLFAQQAAAQSIPADLPAALQPNGLTAYLEVPAKGVQIYTCGKNAEGAWAWSFKAPEAELSDTKGAPLGKHYAGPTWEGTDGGKVVGAAKGNAPSPSGSIAWLLLDIKSREGTGRFTAAQAVLRIATTGGVMPKDGCDEAHGGQDARVPYTATYLFLK